MTAQCPRCKSPSPERHPAVQFGGEVEICTHDFHLRETPQNTPSLIVAVMDKRLVEFKSAVEYVAHDRRSGGSQIDNYLDARN